MSNKPQIRLATKVLFNCPRFAVREDITQPHHGGVQTYVYIETLGGVVILPFLNDGRIILLRQYRYTVGDYCWELPAGGIETGETPAEAAARELMEETGMQAEDLVETANFYPSNGISSEVVHVFLARGLSVAEESQCSSEEQIEIHQVRLNEAMELLSSGGIPGASSLIALLSYWFKQNLPNT